MNEPTQASYLALLPERIYSKIAFAEGGGCYLWTATKGRSGYGHINWNGAVREAHRAVYTILISDPGKLELDHLCHNADLACPGGRCSHRLCVRIGHLRPGSHRENVLAGRTFVADEAKRTHCPRNHPYDEVNTFYERSGTRKCRTCRRAYDLARAPERNRVARLRRSNEGGATL